MTNAARADGAPRGAPAPYGAAHEHLADLLRRHALLLRRRIERDRMRRQSEVLGFAAIGDDEVRALLDEVLAPRFTDAGALDDQLERLERSIAARVEATARAGVRLPIAELASRFALTGPEIDLLFPCLAIEVDRRYERVYGFLHDDMSRRLPSAALVLALYCDSVDDQLRGRALLGAQGRLRHFRLLEVLDDGGSLPSLSRAMRIDERVAGFLLGDDAIDQRIAHHVADLDGAADAIAIGDKARDSVDRVVQAAGATRGDARSLIYLHAPRASGTDQFVRSTARRLGVPVLTVDADSLLDPGADFERDTFLLFREALLSQAALYLRHLDRALEPPSGQSRYRTLLRCVTQTGGIVFASGEQSWSWPLPPEPIVFRIVGLELDGVSEQLATWRAVTDGRFGDAELHAIISLHPLAVPAIHDAWRMARQLAEADDDASGPAIEQVRRACRALAGTPATPLARRVEPKHRWADLVLPAAQLEQLTAICSQAKHSSIVYGAWQFERRLSLGRGLNALFTGVPGTGKTMAAEVIAADLGVDLLKIDLSQIVSKYIGETEKNLRQLFDQAASANAILFFDEADALLGKRSDVKDAHDRFANTETAYLLQKMEEYPGITILATNLRQNMDAAFTRRMRFIVDFPFPEEDDRLRIWQTVWPAEVPLGDDVDVRMLASRFRLSGGGIRNVALSAAFLAAEQAQPVSMRHLMRATIRELQKMGRLVDEEERRRYG